MHDSDTSVNNSFSLDMGEQSDSSGSLEFITEQLRTKRKKAVDADVPKSSNSKTASTASAPSTKPHHKKTRHYNKRAKKSASRDDNASETSSIPSESSASIASTVSTSCTTNVDLAKYVVLDARSVAFLDHYENLFGRFNYDSKSNSFIFPPHARVVTLLELNVTGGRGDNVQLYKSEYMCSGTVLEMASVSNFNRYLILFDNGCVQYIKGKHLFPIFDFRSWPTDGRLHIDHLKFLSQYFEL
jgi:hypothetical protein